MGFSERLRQLRQLRHLTLDELAVSLESTKTTLSRYENNKRIPDADFIVKAAGYFKVSTDYLLGLTSHPTRVDDFLIKKHYYIDGLSDVDYKTLEVFIEDLKHKSQRISQQKI